MSSLRSFINALTIAAACAIIGAPLAANAEDKPTAPRVEKVSKRHHDRAEFPMEPTKFTEMVDKKLEHARTQMEAILTANAVPDGIKAQIRKDFDAAAVKVRAAAKEAGKDGKVTKEEAKDVRHDARSFMKQLHEKYGKAKDADKDANKGHGKHHRKAA